MKIQKTLTLFIVILLSQLCFAQETPKAVLVDEFGRIGCEEHLARLDGFFSELNKSPNGQGYAVIYGKNDTLRSKIIYELWLNGAIKFRQVESLGIRKIRGSETEYFKIQLWKVPAGVETPKFNEGVWDFTFKPNTKPFVFHDYTYQICSPESFEKIYAEYLNANPQSRAHIVIYESSRKKFEKEKRAVLNLLKDIDSRKLRFFFVESVNLNTEFWLVPSKN